MSRFELTSKCFSVANYIIEQTDKYNADKALGEHVLMHTHRLQKLLYFCDIEFMKSNNGKSFFDDQFYAFSNGPVIPVVYSLFIQCTDSKIMPKYHEAHFDLLEHEKNIIDKVLEDTREMDTIDLAQLSKDQNGPWSRAYALSSSTQLQVMSKGETADFYLNSNAKGMIKIIKL